jgi:hypothetical protein
VAAHGRCELSLLVATDAGKRLAWLNVGETSHGLNRQPIAVEGLEEKRNA